MPKLIRGDKLTPAQREHVLNAFGYRHTFENEARQKYWHGNHTPLPTMPRISDEQWLKEHAFWFNTDGSFTRNKHYAEPAYMAKE